MRLRTGIGLSVAVILLGLLWLAWPFYEHYAHRGHVPFPPGGWLAMPADSPTVEDLRDPAYGEAGKATMAAMQAHRAKIGAPAMSAAVAIDGKVVWRGAAGWADMESEAPATLQTRFRIGSTSKAITGTALARLVDQGVIDLDTPISQYMEKLPNPAWAEITPRQLASHMAGLPHYNENTDWLGGYHSIALQTHYADVRDAVEVFDESELLFAPGTDFHYSTLGTVLLGAVMSEAAGIPYRELVAEQVFEPVGMRETVVAPETAGGAEAMATSYYHEDGRYRVWRPVDQSHRLPGGGWASTPSDLARMGVAFLDEDYLSRSTRETFWTPQRLESGEVNPQNYALGWRWHEMEMGDSGVLSHAHHGGVSRGGQALLMVLPDYDMAIAFTINMRTDNFGDFGSFFSEVLRPFVRAYRQQAEQ